LCLEIASISTRKSLADVASKLQSALVSEEALLRETQMILSRSLKPDDLTLEQAIDLLHGLLDGLHQRAIQERAREALGHYRTWTK
jgi:hypothetical protein